MAGSKSTYVVSSGGGRDITYMKIPERRRMVMARTRKSPIRLWTPSLERLSPLTLPNFLNFMSSSPSDKHRHRANRDSGAVNLVTGEGARSIRVQEHQD